MRIMDRIRQVFAAFVSGSSTLWNPTDWMMDWLGGRETDAGVRVDSRSAMTWAPIWSGVKKISGHCGTLDFQSKQKQPDGRSSKVQDIHRLMELVNLRPNPTMSGHQFKETLQAHAILHGNGRAAIMRDSMGIPRELWLLDPRLTMTYLIHETVGDEVRTRKYHYWTGDNGATVIIPDEDCLHVMNYSDTGLQGVGLVTMAKEAIGGGLAGEKATNRLFRNDASPSMIMEAPPGYLNDLSKAKQFIDDHRNLHSGADNKGKMMLLRYGVTAKQWALSSVDAQMLEQKRFSREDAALFLGLPGILGDNEASPYTSVQQETADYLNDCLGPWLSKWTQELTLKLLTRQARDRGYYFDAWTWPLVKGSLDERLSSYLKGRQSGVWSQEEVRELEGMPPKTASMTFDNVYTNKSAQLNVSANPDDVEGLDQQGERTDLTDPNSQALWASVHLQVRKAVMRQAYAIEDYAKTPGKFLDSVDKYWAKQLAELQQTLAELGMEDTSLADRWVERFSTQVMDVASEATADELEQSIWRTTKGWLNYSALITQEIVGAITCRKSSFTTQSVPTISWADSSAAKT